MKVEPRHKKWLPDKGSNLEHSRSLGMLYQLRRHTQKWLPDKGSNLEHSRSLGTLYQLRRHTQKWLPDKGSNLEHHAPEACALPIELSGSVTMNIPFSGTKCQWRSWFFVRRSALGVRRSLLDLTPSIPQSHRAVEDELLGGRIPVHAEVAHSLELVSHAGLSADDARLHITGRHLGRASRTRDCNRR